MKTSSLVLASSILIFNSAGASQDVNTPNAQPPAAAAKKASKETMFSVMGEYLYLQAKEEGLAYGSTSSLPVVVPATLGEKGSVHRIKPKYHSGYRLGVAYFLPQKKGELAAKWMHYEGSHANSAKAPAGGVLWPDWLNMNFDPIATAAHANWHVDLNVFDLRFGTSFMRKNILTVKPFIGFRAAWFNQQLGVNYKNITFINSTTTPSIFSKNNSHSRGYGLCGGLEGAVKVWKGFSLFADGSVSLLWSHFKNSQKEINADGSIRSNLSDGIYTTIPVFEMIAGIAWDYRWNKIGLGLRFGWEGQVWLHQNELSRYLNSLTKGSTQNSQGDFTLTGYNLRATISY